MRFRKIISGGQTGSDRAALVTARKLGIATGGWMPRGYRSLDGPHPEFADLYDMLETDSDAYPPRTFLNVRDSDATVRFAEDFDSRGEACTLRFINQLKRPYLDVRVGASGQTPPGVAAWLARQGVEVLNVAGNSEKSCPGIGDFVAEFLERTIHHLLTIDPRKQ